ncbi:MAG: YbgC/FadM family acyl-CoA thioesterase [Candidatus Omnitrophota bacterium]|nr:YbgC/FadM family acyl-CoA thioesterase [Candidatus Omnitrophota bacterium]MBU3929347.1 acyl-CoA thioesterase [bacterium]MBU4122462.1 acyl-CoA thioesterase [bacterium]
MEIKIYYQDTDCGGVVYYANYLTYFERARTEFLRERGADIGELMERGIFFLVRRAEIDYISPARYGETVIVEVQAGKSTGASIELLYEIKEKASLRSIVKGKTLLVCVGKDMKPMRLPEEMRKIER